MKQPLLFGLLTALALIATEARATDYYVATTGNDSNPGTLAQPFATLQKGVAVAVAGDTVYIRGGVYNIVTPSNSGAGILFSKSGTSDTNRIRYWAYQGEIPAFDFANLQISATGYTHGFVVTGSWLHFKGLEVRNVPMNTASNNGIAVNGGGYDIFELLNLHHNNGNGIFIGKGTGGHLVLNCDAHDNYDPKSSQGDGQNADGFGLHYQTGGAVSVFRGCRAWWNSDDGYDFINQEFAGVIDHCWAFANGYINSGTARPGAGNGNGFKVGSSKTGVRHTVTSSVAWKNASSGFYANHSSGGNDWFNNTSYSNGTQYNMLASDPTDPNIKIVLTGTLVHKMRNNIGFPFRNTNMEGVDTAFNTWDLGITPAASDFVSVSDTGAMGPREADGSLPNLDFMKLPEGSRMIDKGTDVGLPYVGSAPDLGAYEYGATSGTGGTGAGGAGASTGGATSSGGVTGTGGAGVAGTTGAVGGAAAIGAGGATSNGGNGAPGGSAGTADSTSSSPGCACQFAGDSRPVPILWLGSVLGALALGLARRRVGIRFGTPSRH